MVEASGWLPLTGEASAPSLCQVGPTFQVVSSPSLLDFSRVDVRVFSLCKSDMWTSFCYYSDNPCRNRHSPKLVEIVSKNPKSMGMFSFYPLSSF